MWQHTVDRFAATNPQGNEQTRLSFIKQLQLCINLSDKQLGHLLYIILLVCKIKLTFSDI
jgi:hypothetical protein